MNAQWTNFKIVNKQRNQAEKLICEQRNSLRRANKKIGNIFVSNKSNPKQSLGLLLLTHIHNSHAHRFSINLKATYSQKFCKKICSSEWKFQSKVCYPRNSYDEYWKLVIILTARDYYTIPPTNFVYIA